MKNFKDLNLDEALEKKNKKKISLDEHIEILLNKYNLNDDYNKFNYLSMVSPVIRESFYVFILYFNVLIKEYQDEEFTKKIILILLAIYFINIPIEYYLNKIKSQLFEKITNANYNYFNEKIKNLAKTELLSFDLIKYYDNLSQFVVNCEEYIINSKHKNDIAIRLIIVVMIAYHKKILALIPIAGLLTLIINKMNKKKLEKEYLLVDKKNIIDFSIRQYLSNSKSLLINNNINNEYLNKKLINSNNYNNKITSLNNNTNNRINYIIFIGIIVLILKRDVKFDNNFDLLVYFLIIYDIEYITDKMNLYYTGLMNYNKIITRLDTLYDIKTETNILGDPNKYIDRIIITTVEHSTPYISNKNTLIINRNEPVLIDGISGSGKTSLLYIFKGIIKPDIIEINHNLETISLQSYITLSNYKDLFNGKLFDIISNYNENPNIDLINNAIRQSKFNKFENEEINVDLLSAGERMRLLVAKIIYNIKIKNYSILLFDEIDENLNNDTAIELCKNIISIFNDKMILYITHNEQVKQLFKKKMFVVNGEITLI